MSSRKIIVDCIKRILTGDARQGEGAALATLRNALEYLSTGKITGLRGVATHG